MPGCTHCDEVKRRCAAESEALAALRQNAFLTTINYDNIEWLTETYGDEWPFDTVIVDESTRLKGLL